LKKEPILSFDLYDSFILANSIVSLEAKFQYVQILVFSLPKLQYEIFFQLMTLFELILQNKAINHSSSESITDQFSNLILRPREIVYYMEGDEEVVRVIVKLIIDNFNNLKRSDS